MLAGFKEDNGLGHAYRLHSSADAAGRAAVHDDVVVLVASLDAVRIGNLCAKNCRQDEPDSHARTPKDQFVLCSIPALSQWGCCGVDSCGRHTTPAQR